MATPQQKIFISYRRDDNRDFVEMIWSYFARKYGRKNVFLDVDTIPPGVNFADYIRKEVEQCDMVLAIIGPDWLELLNKKRLSYEDDYVLIELSLALQLDKLVTPICIMNAATPKKSELPPELRPLLKYNATSLHLGGDFLDKIEHVLEEIDERFKERAQQYYESGKVKFEAKDYKGAIADCTEAIRLYPKYAEAYHGRSMTQRVQGKPDSALVDANQAIKFDKHLAKAYYNVRLQKL